MKRRFVWRCGGKVTGSSSHGRFEDLVFIFWRIALKFRCPLWKWNHQLLRKKLNDPKKKSIPLNKNLFISSVINPEIPLIFPSAIFLLSLWFLLYKLTQIGVFQCFCPFSNSFFHPISVLYFLYFWHTGPHLLFLLPFHLIPIIAFFCEKSWISRVCLRPSNSSHFSRVPQFFQHFHGVLNETRLFSN